jgi:uncharacterized protein (TIGR02466 family)
MAKTINLFSVPIYTTKIDINKIQKTFLKNLPLNLVEEKNGLMSNDKYVLHKKELSNIKKDIDKAVYVYKNDILKIDDNIEFFIVNSWLMRHDKNHYAHEHSHANSVISGVYYVDVPEMSGNLIFHKASNNISNAMSPVIALKYKQYTTYTSEEYSVKTKNNLLVLFPSNLRHSVPISFSNKPRYCIAFNTFIKGDLTINGVDTLNFG